MAVNWLILDSGWGGLNFTAHLFRQIPDKNNSVQLIFANVQPSETISYHRLPDEAARSAHLKSDLHELENLFQPERIIIACNTLSVLYSKSGISCGCRVQLNTEYNTGILLQLQKEYGQALLLATPITASSGYYQQHCPGLDVLSMPGLAGAIEDYGDGTETELLIREGLRQQLADTDQRPGVIFLGCTHFGYVQHRFEHSTSESGLSPVPVINPDLGFAAHCASETACPGQAAALRIIARFKPAPNVSKNLRHFLADAGETVLKALNEIEITQ